MGWLSWDRDRKTPKDSLLTVDADLVSTPDHPNVVIHGWLDLTETGLRWRPASGDPTSRQQAITIDWGRVAGIDGARIWAHGGQLRTWVSIETTIGDKVELTIATERRDEVAEVLSRFLEQPGPDPRPPAPFATS